MSSFVAWLRRTVPVGTTSRDWVERAAALALVSAATVLLVFFTHLPLSQQVVLWGLLIVAFAFVARRGWLTLFGPVLFYDMLRTSRRMWHFLVRVLYAGAILLVLLILYFSWVQGQGTGHAISANEAAGFASTFFYTFMGIQFALAAAITPAYTAGAIAEEKERKTLEFLLATDLNNREIVLSKLVSRILNLTLLLLTGLPVLASLQFLGGVDPGLVLAGFAATGLTIASLAGLSVYNSTMSRRARDAIVLTYLMVLSYLVLSGLSWLLLLPTGWQDFPSPNSPVRLRDVVEGFNVGNLFAVVINMSLSVNGGTPLDQILPGALRNYAIFHGIIAVGAPLLAIFRLRAVATAEASQTSSRGPKGRRGRRLPRVRLHAMIWKEVFAEPGFGYRMHWLGKAVVVLLVLLSFVPTVTILILADSGGLGSSSDSLGAFSEAINIYQVRVAGGIVACLLLMAVAVRAAGAVSGERERLTFDELLTTPMDSDAILFAKWLGAVLSVRKGWLWLGAIYALGLLTLGLHPLSLGLLVVAWCIYAAFVALVGLWFSMTARTTLRATVWTLVATLGAAFGHWLLWLCCLPVFIFGGSSMPAALEWVAKFQFGLTPPAALAGLLPFGWSTLRENVYNPEQVWEMVGHGVLGTVVWAVLAGVLWVAASTKFRELSGRVPLGRPRPRAAPRPVQAEPDERVSPLPHAGRGEE